MRLIALTTLLNKGDVDRLRAYIADNYHAGVLAETPVSMRLAELKAIHRLAGKLRIHQVIAANKYQVIAIVEGERGNQYIAQVTVEEDYPHKLLDYNLQLIPSEHEEPPIAEA